MAHDWNTLGNNGLLACGFVIDTLLMVNNFRDREQDAISGRKPSSYGLGARAGLILYFYWDWLHAGAVSILSQGRLWAAILPQIYLLFLILTTMKMARINRGKN